MWNVESKVKVYHIDGKPHLFRCNQLTNGWCHLVFTCDAVALFSSLVVSSQSRVKSSWNSVKNTSGDITVQQTSWVIGHKKKQPLTNALMKLTHKTLGRDLNGCRRGEALGTRLPARLSHQIYGACASRDTIRHLRVSQLVSLCTAAPSSQNKIGKDTTCLPPKCYRTFAFNFSWV